MAADSFWTFLAASSVSGVCVCIAMQPPDTVRLKSLQRRISGMFTNFFFFTFLCTLRRLSQGCTIVSYPPSFSFFLIFFFSLEKLTRKIENLQKTQSKIPSLVKSAALFIRIPLTASGRRSRLKVLPGGTKVCFFLFFFFLLHFLKRIGADG